MYNVGVGDVIQYSSSGGAVIDSVVFIHKRNSTTEFEVRLADGKIPPDLNIANNTWEIYRAYTSLNNVGFGDENSGIDGAVDDFDLWTAGEDLITKNLQLNFALYADAVDNVPTAQFNNFNTGANNELNIFVPFETSDVGDSQRHEGKWDNRFYQLNITDPWGEILISGNTSISGLQVSSSTGLTGASFVRVVGGQEIYVDSFLAKGLTDLGNDSAFAISADQNYNAQIYFTNNINKAF